MNAYRVRKFHHERSSVQIASIHAARQRLPGRSPQDIVKAKGNSTVVAAVGEILRRKFYEDRLWPLAHLCRQPELWSDSNLPSESEPARWSA
jgi:hypothetical protein